MLKMILAGIYDYVRYIEPFVLLFAILLYFIHFFKFWRRSKQPLLCVAVFFVAISCALSVAILLNRFMM